MSTPSPLYEPFVRSAYNYDMDAASKATGIVFVEPGFTQQQFKEETDINTIVRRFGVTGQLPQAAHLPTYDDFSQVVDYHTAMNAIRTAEDSFLGLPAEVRLRFANNPQLFLDFCSDERNREEAARLGLTSSIPAPPINRPVEPPPPQPA